MKNIIFFTALCIYSQISASTDTDINPEQKLLEKIGKMLEVQQGLLAIETQRIANEAIVGNDRMRIDRQKLSNEIILGNEMMRLKRQEVQNMPCSRVDSCLQSLYYSFGYCLNITCCRRSDNRRSE